MTDKEVIKKMYQLLLTEPHAPTLCDQLESIAREALAQPEQEPVAWQWLGSAHFRKKLPKNADVTAWNPLYTTPPEQPAPMSQPNRVIAYSAAIKLRELGYKWVDDAWKQPAPVQEPVYVKTFHGGKPWPLQPAPKPPTVLRRTHEI
tara:strand:- start:1141 stop:1581 length:441 start_codon:yes stop_codon:yes gene_type:complete